MTDNQDKFNLIEDYLENKLSSSDAKEVENLLANDSNFKQEFDFQSEVIDALKGYRKVELKNRLGSIPVQSSLIGSLVSNSAYMQSLVMGGIGAIVGASMFFSLNSPGEIFTKESISVNKIVEVEVASAIEAIAIAEGIEAIKIEKVRRRKPSLVIKSETPVLASKPSEKVLPKDEKTALADIKIDIDVSDDEGIFKDDYPENDLELDLKKRSSSQISQVEPGNLKVATIVKSNNTYQYKFSKGKLYLYGDFGDEKYEILEINSEKGKKVILFLQGSYYDLDVKSKKPTSLSPIVNLDRIQEIEILKKVKLGQ